MSEAKPRCRVVLRTYGPTEKYHQCLIQAEGYNSFTASWVKPTMQAAIADLVSSLPIGGITVEEFCSLPVTKERSLIPGADMELRIKPSEEESL